jgi:hypothetical protein
MAGDYNKANEQFTEFQNKTLEQLRAQQESYLAAVKKWREMLAKGGVQPPQWPEFKAPNMSPQATEVVEASYAFAAKLLAEQSRFMTELSKTMTSPGKKS